MPRRHLNLIAVMVCAVLPVYGAAGEAPQAAGALGKAPATLPKPRMVQAAGSGAVSGSDAAISTTLRDVLIRNWVIAVNQYTAFEWQADLTGADKVHVSLTSVGDSNSRLSNVHIVVAFAGPGDWYVVSDVIQGNTFPYYDHISFTVPVYAPLMKLIVYNDGPNPVQITQLSAYAVTR